MPILAAQRPDPPGTPSTEVIVDDITINWPETVNQGSAITSYQILIRHSDGISFSEELFTCDGTISEVASARQCITPVSTVRALPFNLQWGTGVYVKVSATNAYGTSDFSTVGNGGIIITSPDPPVSLSNVPTVTNALQIGLSWQAAAFDGGTNLLDYRLTYDQGADVYSVLATGIVATSYTVTGLVTGNTYKFKLQARNEYGYSDYSDTVAILTA